MFYILLRAIQPNTAIGVESITPDDGTRRDGRTEEEDDDDDDDDGTRWDTTGRTETVSNI